MGFIHYVGHHVGSVTVRAAVSTNTYKKIHEDKVPFDAICLVCEKASCERGECSLVGGKDIMDKNKKAAKAQERFYDLCNLPLGNEPKKSIAKKQPKVNQKNGGNRNESPVNC